jgi:hypothetical protein
MSSLRLSRVLFGGQARVDCYRLQARGGLQMRQQQSKGSNNFWGVNHAMVLRSVVGRCERDERVWGWGGCSSVKTEAAMCRKEIFLPPKVVVSFTLLLPQLQTTPSLQPSAVDARLTAKQLIFNTFKRRKLNKSHHACHAPKFLNTAVASSCPWAAARRSHRTASAWFLAVP